MGSLIMRAFDLGVITDRQKRYLWAQMSSRGYRLQEPKELDIPVEKPTALQEILNLHVRELGYTDEELKEILYFISDEEYKDLNKNFSNGLRLVKP